MRLLGRESELAGIDRLQARVRAGDGGAVVLRGPVGIGKSALLRTAADAATARGVRVLEARAIEAEREYAFGVVLRLLEPVVAGLETSERDSLFGGAARTAGALFADGPHHVVTDLFSSVHGLWWVLSTLAERQPLMLVVDDIQFADEPSLRVLAFAASRLEGEPLGLLAAARAGLDEPSEVLDALIAAPEVAVIQPQPLRHADVSSLVEQALGEPGDDPFVDACVRASGGNPFLLTELLRSLRRAGVAPQAANAPSVRGITPDAVRERVARDLADSSAESRAFATALAVLGDGAPLHRVAALAELPLEAAEREAEALARGGLLAEAASLSFSQPLLRGAVLGAVPGRRRAALHSRAAALLREHGELAERVAAHLLHGDRRGDAAAVSDLRRAAARAAANHAPRSAIAYLARALEEPPPREQHAQVLLELATAEADAALPGAREHLNDAIELSEGQPEVRAAAALRLGELLVLWGDLAGARDTFAAGALSARAVDSPLLGELEAAQVMVTAHSSSHGGPERVRALERLEPDSASAVERSVLAQQAMHGAFTMQLDHQQALALVRRAMRGSNPVRDEGAESLTMRFITGTLALCDALDFEVELLDGVLERERRQGSLLGFATTSYSRAFALYFMGRIGEATADLELALGAERHGWNLYIPPARALLALLHLERADMEAARAALALPPRPEWTGTVLWGFILAAGAEVALADGRPERALELAEQLREQARVTGMTNPGIGHEDGLAARALHALGQEQRALELAQGELERSRRWGAPRTLAISLRTAAAVDPDTATRVRLLREAADVLEQSPSGLERTRVLLDLGQTLLEAGDVDDARERLREAFEIADANGLLLLAGQARAALASAGLRPRRAARRGTQALTPAERRVSGLAAEGLSNREIAESLFVTVKTVEKHLRGSYAKLGVESRTDLAQRLDAA
jgi:DNA-binding CsgD family transcriptional regulator